MDQEWLTRIRLKLGIVPKSVEKFPPVIQPKPLQPDIALAASPCPHPAGSFEKIAVMRQRAANGQSLFHPHDNHEMLVRNNHPHIARVG